MLPNAHGHTFDDFVQNVSFNRFLIPACQYAIKCVSEEMHGDPQMTRGNSFSVGEVLIMFHVCEVLERSATASQKFHLA